jgi:phage gp36-like protein
MPCMSYATIQQLTERYLERDLRHITDPDAQALDAARAQQALDDATAEIDAWLGRRYALPLVSYLTGLPVGAPIVLVRCACDIAIYRMQTLRPADDIKDARQRYEDVVKLLKSMASGDVAIPEVKLRSDVSDNPETQAIGLPEFGQPDSLFGRGYR